MPTKEVTTPYPVLDIDPHAFRVVRYFRGSDYGAWATTAGAFPLGYYLWEKFDPTHTRDGRSAITAPAMRTALRICGVTGFCAGFLLAYQRSSLRFFGWSENKREEDMDFKELSQRAADGKPLYGASEQPAWVLGAAYRNSVFSQLKLASIPWVNMVNHPHHGTDPAKYGVKSEVEQQ